MMAHGHPDVSIVILNWNSHDDLVRCLEKLDWWRGSITIVDNGSASPPSPATLPDGPYQLELVHLGRNLGYAGGMNAGMRNAAQRGHKRALLLNPDTLPDEIALVAMMATRADVAGIAQTHEMTLTDGIARGRRYVTAAMTSRGVPTPFVCDGCATGGHDVDVVTGAALLVNLDTARRVGLMDERFFHYKEEFDFVWRIKHAGGSVRFICAFALRHIGGGSLRHESSLARYYHARNEVLFVRWRLGVTGLISHAGLLRLALVSRASFLGFLDGVLGRSGKAGRKSVNS